MWSVVKIGLKIGRAYFIDNWLFTVIVDDVVIERPVIWIGFRLPSAVVQVSRDNIEFVYVDMVKASIGYDDGGTKMLFIWNVVVREPFIGIES